MKRLLLPLLFLSATAHAGSADLFRTQTNELSQSSFDRLTAFTVSNTTAETGTTSQVIVATAHSARIGDMIRVTQAGANYYAEAHVASTTTNSITLQRVLPAAMANGDTFSILRLITPAVSSTGATNIAGAVTTTAQSHAFADSKRNDYSSVNVTNAAWVQMIASTAAASTQFTLFDSSGVAIEIGTGAAASETRVAIIPPGGFDGPIQLNIPAGTRIALKAMTATSATAGEFDLTLFQ